LAVRALSSQGRPLQDLVEIPEDQPDWFDYDVHTDVEGFPADGSYVHLIATPFKRGWSAYWFKPIARIGSRGNDEYMLNSV